MECLLIPLAIMFLIGLFAPSPKKIEQQPDTFVIVVEQTKERDDG